MLLQCGQLLSSAGSESTTIAYPLLVLALTQSAAKAGVVTFARLLPFALVGLLAGIAADRFDRRLLMIGADGMRAVAVAALGAAIVLDAVAFWQIPVVAFVEGAGRRCSRRPPRGRCARWSRPGSCRPPRARSRLIGLLLASFGVCVLLGSLASPLFRRLLSARAILLLELWMWPGCALFVAWPDVYVLMASILPSALAIPVTDSVVIGYRLAITPDRLVGRVESVRSTIALASAPLGPLAAGLVASAWSARAAIAVFAALGLVLALCGTLSRAIRGAPSLAELG